MMPSERRRHERVPYPTELTVVDLTTQCRLAGHGIDLSLWGIGFYVESFLEVGTRIALLLQPRHGGAEAAEPIEATVRWTRVETGGAIVGAEFSQTLSPTYRPRLYESLCNA